MRRSLVLGLLLVTLAISARMGLGLAQQAAESPRAELWKQVDEAMEKGLPKTAAEKLAPIIEQAKEAKDWPEAIRAAGLKIALEGNIQGNKPEEKVTLMRAAIEDSPAEMRPVMHAILAHWYWHYFQQNRWRIIQRTQTSESPGDDLTAWPLARIMREIDAQFEKALAEEETLKKTPIAEYHALLVKGTMPDTYRPTLFDFIAHEAIAFHSSGENTLVAPEDEFTVAASGPVFGTVEEFLAWNIEDTSNSPLARSLRLFQNLLRFHEDDEDRTAFLAADLDRLQLGWNKAVGDEDEKQSRYVAALKRFAEAHRTHETASHAIYLRATVVRGQEKLVEAREIALQGKNLHPESVGGKLCHNLIVEIEAKSFQVTTERVWTEPLPTIDVRYRNLSQLHFRAVAIDFSAWLKSKNRRPEWLDVNDRREVLAKQPQKAWSVTLPATPDYKEREESLPVPDDLPPGFYFLLASHDEDFGADDNVVQFCDVWVSDLALVSRVRNGETLLEGFVLNADTGAPLAGAEVQLWTQNSTQRQRNYELKETVQTDDDGRYRFRTADRQNHLILAKHGDHQLASASDFYTHFYSQRPSPTEQTIFFTDRALYRPGQTIRFKGLAIRVDHAKDDYAVIKNRKLAIVFRDPNGEQLERLEVATNDFGSFQGSFTAPRDRLMGRMTIFVEGGPSGATQVSVEEYKRPKFQVKFDAPADAPKLGGEVTLEGTAAAYTGAPIDGANVRWRVVRRVRFPDWWHWYRGWMFPHRDDREIAHGRAQTDADGTFQVTFTAVPDETILEKDEPVFTYEVTADVTDNTGETRSAARDVRVAYTALQASMSADDWQTEQKPVEITITTKSHDGEGRAAKGVVRVHRLVPPESVQRPELPGVYRPRRMVAQAGKAVDGENPDPDLSDPKQWPLGDVVSEHAFETDAKGTAKLEVALKAGAYQAVLETQDRFGKPVAARLNVQVIDPGAEKLALKIPFLLAAPKWSLEPGEELTAVWGSGYDAARAFVEIEHRGKIVRSFWTDRRHTQARIELPITEELRGGFTLRVTMVRENRAYLQSRQVAVPWTNKELTVKWERFTSRLKPGAEEHWTAIVTGPDSQRAVAEMVATLYDASLDAYLPHHWMERLSVFRTDHSNLRSQFENQAKWLQHIHGNWKHRHIPVTITYRAFPMEIVGYYYGYQWLQNANRDGKDMLKLSAAPGFASRGIFDDRAEKARGGGLGGMALAEADGVAPAAPADFANEGRKNALAAVGQDKPAGAPSGPDPGDVAARKNLAETAFFFPHLVASKEGEVRLEFTMPEALTEWK
ncbi:MAG: MG2 domain-containing protein, partial [Planctomycetaceae bacterium]